MLLSAATVDPYVVSIDRTSPPGPITNAGSVTFTATFSEPVTGVDSTDFSPVVTGSVATTGTTFALVTTSVYTVTVSGITGDGTLGLNLVDDGTIRDTDNNPLTTQNAPASFADQVLYTTGSSPTSVVFGDVNGDHIPDMVVANFGDDNVGVLLGNGDGTFAAQQTFATGSNPHSVALGDLDGDGNLDLVVANFGGSTVSVLLGDGAGNFTAQPAVTVGVKPTSVALAYVDGDGVLDLVVSNGTDNTVSVLLGDGIGGFVPQPALVTGASPWSVAVGDLNGDNFPDIVVSNFGESSVSVFLGDGTGAFGAQTTFLTGSKAESVTLGDLNADNILDLIVSNWSDGTVSTLLGNGDGTFQTQQTFATGSNPASVMVGDVNGDGNVDVVVGNYGSNTVSVLLGNGNGTLAAQQTFAAGTNAFAVAIGDVNGDGRPDLAVTNLGASSVSVLLANGNGNFTGQLYTIDSGPVISSVTISPSSPTTNQVLTTTVVSSDPLSLPVTYTYQWQKNGTNIPGETGSTLDLSVVGNGDKGDAITVVVTPDDGSVTGAPFTSPSVTVADTAPDVTSATITPGSPTTNQTLTANVVSTDDDSDPVSYSYQWTNNGVNIPGETGSTLDLSVAGNGDKNDAIAVIVTPSDGTLSGTAFTSPSVTVVDSAPVISSVTISPSSPTTNQTLTSSVVSSDADGDPVTYSYQWTKSGVNLPGETGSTLDLSVAGNGDKGDAIAVIVTPNDGTLNGTAFTSPSVTVADTAPVISSVTISPAFPRPTQTLTTTVVSSDVDGDPVTYSYQWQKNGVNIPGATSSTLDLTVPGNGANGDSIRVIVTPNDGTLSGNPFTSAAVIVDGVDPYVVSINRGTPPGAVTNASTVSFTVTFSEPVTGVDATDFVLAKTGTVATTGITVTPVTTSVYTVTVTGITGSGTLGLNLVDNGSIFDLAGNPLDNPTATATFGNQTTFATGAGPFSMALADVNSDGKADLIVANKTSNTMSVFLGNGNGTFAAPQTFATGSSPIAVAIGDVNGDGKKDVVVANYGSNTVSVLLGNGDGTFAPQQTFAAGTILESLALGDFNGDGKADIVVATYNSHAVNVLLNNGNGTFAAPISLTTGTGPYSVTVGDLNGDGKTDLVVANRGSASVSVLLGNGNGTFAAQQTFASGVNPDSVTLGDVNGDGKTDLVVANHGSNSVSVLLGNGNGTFAAQQTFATGALPVSLALGDVNGDGKLDIVVSNYGSNTVNVLLGNGNGTFQPQQAFANSTHPRPVALADLNGDGKLDILVANVGNNTVSVLLGNYNGNFTGQTYTITSGPVVTSATISPSSPTTNQTLTATVVSSDSLGNPVTYTYQWQKNGVNIPGATGSTLNLSGAGNGDKGDVITVIVTPNDGVLTGNPFTSPSVTVIDTAPVVSSVTISPSSPTTNQTLTATVVSSDADSDPVTYSYQWTKNGVNIPGATGSSLDLSIADNGDKGDVIAVKVTPNDGTLSGTVFTSPSVTVGDSAPVISSVTINPGSPTTNQTLTTTVVSSDPDGDAVTYTYQWTKNGVNIPGATGSTLNLGTSGNGDRGDVIAVIVTPHDATLNGAAFTSPSVTVADTAPVVSSVTISPAFPRSNQTFTATVVSSDADSDPVTYSYQWQKNGVNIPGATGSTLNLPSTINGDSIRVIVTPNDGTLSGTPFTSAAVTIDGIDPYVVSINRGTPPGPNTNASSVSFTVTFSEPVMGVDLADFLRVTTGTVATTGITVTPVTTTVYTVTITGITGAGTLGLNLVDNGSIHDLAGNPLDNPGSPASFASQTTFATGPAPTSVTSGDVNNDGIPDLIVTNFSSDTVGVLIGNGNGTFAPQQAFATGPEPHSVALGDVNNDGIPDLIVANFGTSTVSVLLGNGNGTFQTQQTFAAGTEPTFVTLLDANGDGKPDLAVSNGVSNTVSVLLGNGNGTFAAQQTFATGTQPWSVAAGDLNGDGKTDLVVSNFGGSSISVLLGNGDGTFGAQQMFATGSRAESVTLGDVNGDGKLDAVVSNWNDGTVSVLLGTGNGTFQPQTTLATGSNPASAMLGDVNGDGKTDIVVGNYGSNTVSVLLGNGNGTFAPQQTFAAGAHAFAIAIGDLNGDGKADLAVTNQGASNVSVLLGNYNGNFTGQVYTITAGPVITSVTISPSSPKTNQTLTTTVVSTDSLGNPVTYTYQWQKNGVNIPGATGSTLNLSVAGNGDKGDVITVIVTPNDGVLTGAAFTSPSVLVVDCAPVISSVTITPSGPKTNQTLTATVVSSDADGDPVTYSYQWTKNGVNIPGATGSTLNLSVAGNGDKGDVIAVKVTPNDGTLNGAVFTSPSVTVVNCAPVISSVTISPSGPTTNQTLTTTVVSTDADGDPVTYTYQWTKNGVNIPGATGSTLNLSVAGNGDKGDVIAVKVTPNDGTVNGATFTAPSVTVADTPPVISSVTITPANPGLNQTLTATVVSSDADGDPVTYSYQWQKNGVNIPGATGSTLNTNGLVNGDSVRVVVTPNDGTLSGTSFTSAAVTIDGIHPYVISINRGTPPGPTTNATSVCFVVTFSEPVTGVDPTDFVLAKTGTVGATGVTVTPVSTSVYKVTVNGITGNGTLGLNLVDNGSIHDLAGNPLDNPTTTASFANQTTFATGSGPFSMTLSDVNGDGKADLIIANRTSNTMSVFLGHGNGTFGAPQNFATGTSPISVTVGDVNGDGKPDVVVTNFGSNSVSVLLGNGNGTFAAQHTFATGTSPISATLSDVNGDGKADIIVANYASNNVSVLLGNGNGTFATQTTFATGAAPYSVKACDLNGDGKADLIVANRGSGTVSVLLGNGNGTFATQHTFATGANPDSITLGDVNQDGKTDLVVANHGSNSVSVLLGNGNGTFASQQTFATGALPVSLALGDVNGDGKLDIVVSNYGSNTVNVLLGNGNGTFQPQKAFATATHPSPVVLGDVNGDGKLDILVANVGNNSVSVLLGNNNGNFTGQLYTIDQGPVISSVTISPGSPTTNQTLTTTVVSSDPLGFAVTYTYQWRKNGVNIPGATGSTLNLGGAGNGDKGDVITVIVTPSDGFVTGAAFTSPSVTVVDTAPVIAPQTFSVPGGSANMTIVGTVIASDVDPGDTKTFSITAGNSLGAFTISASGVITVANSTKLVKATNPTFSLTVKVLDSSGLFSTAVVTINLT